ncbi:hypothetical protein MJG53_018291 [Ovis ammon polii x Ovis aries]|uniref:Uncharacterized protein n=2 Tax=Ovis TaxID=9935 RepID=A0A835ZMY7_SHEEP|nr:hypothetical protein JEQ12_012648 [Ovis aries]KAI4559765.1 hypothetical protein MJG53_018291 [Ovis ammon polii x Ovis aries]
MSPASTCSVPNSTTGSGPGMVRRAMFYKPQEPGFYSVAAPAGPGCGHPSRGSPEGPVCHPREHYLTLWNRKGFVCLALRHGASLVPVYSFGENDIFRVKAFAPDSWQHHLQEVPGHFSLHLLPRLFSAKSWGLVPLARPITTVEFGKRRANEFITIVSVNTTIIITGMAPVKYCEGLYVIQWMGTGLPVPGTQMGPLVREDPTERLRMPRTN